MIKPPKLNNEPTKTSPHRWCRFLHFWQSVIMVPFALLIFFHSIVNLVYIVASGAAITFVLYVVRGRKTDGDLYLEDRVDRKNRAAFGSTTYKETTDQNGEKTVTPVTVPMPLNTHPVWTFVAVVFDIFFFALAILTTVSATRALTNGTFDRYAQLNVARNGEVMSATEVIVWGAISVGVAAFRAYAHYKASKPRKPRRQRMWLFGTQSQGS